MKVKFFVIFMVIGIAYGAHLIQERLHKKEEAKNADIYKSILSASVSKQVVLGLNFSGLFSGNCVGLQITRKKTAKKISTKNMQKLTELGMALCAATECDNCQFVEIEEI
jgi:hypothetical protein